jgi:nucleotidyltransferase/DNA polymerase involved in DNA repair
VPRSILHVDMDAFYAAVEQRDRPELRGKPVIVGADPRGGRGRGVVSTASYEARRFGVGSAMPISQAYRLCPQGVFLPVDMEKYVGVSKQVMEVLRRYTDLVEPISIDEAFLDVTGSARAFGSGEEIACDLKRGIREQTALTASVGLAACKLVAKIASDMKKPDGLVVVPAGEEAAFLAPLPIRRLWGVGPKLEEQLVKLGIHTVGQLAAADASRLSRRFGTHGQDLVLLARGIDERPISTGAEAKSVGQEHTYDADTADVERLRRTLLDLADGVAGRLRHARLRGRTITLKYRDETFRTLTRAETLPQPTDSGNVLFETAWRLFQAVHGRRRVRLLGIYTSGFAPRPQLELFPEDTARAGRADKLRDAVAERFGAGSLTRASLLGRRERRHPEALGETGEIGSAPERQPKGRRTGR